MPLTYLMEGDGELRDDVHPLTHTHSYAQMWWRGKSNNKMAGDGDPRCYGMDPGVDSAHSWGLFSPVIATHGTTREKERE